MVIKWCGVFWIHLYICGFMEKLTKCNNWSINLGRIWSMWWKSVKNTCIFISLVRIVAFIQSLFKLCTFSAKPGTQQLTGIHCDLSTYERWSREYLWPAEMNGLLHTLTVQLFSRWDDGFQCLILTTYQRIPTLKPKQSMKTGYTQV